jgi:hypothetical protein
MLESEGVEGTGGAQRRSQRLRGPFAILGASFDAFDASVRLRMRKCLYAFVPFAVFAAPPALPYEHQFTNRAAAEIIATVTARCDRCDWSVEGREAVVLRLTLDGRYVQHVPLVRTGTAEYRLMLGNVPAGTHTLLLAEDSALTARELRGTDTAIENVSIEELHGASRTDRAIALAPFIYARPDTVGRFSDVPALMWYEVERTAAGERYRYTVIFTNEDGGTPTDRLMATWGRTTDIEYIYSVEVNGNGDVLHEDLQGPKHEILPFRGKREARHPMLWVSTDNNMVLDTGTTAVRYAPAPMSVTLQDVSRETIMDAQPWLYELATKELSREGKIVPDAPPGKGRISDPRRFVYVEACGEVGTAALALAVQVGGDWIASDRGVPEYRIVRDGCFRAAVPLPRNATAREIRALRAQAYTRVASGNTPPPKPSTVRLTRVNRVFMLDDAYRPQASFMRWSGDISITPDGPPVQIAAR